MFRLPLSIPFAAALSLTAALPAATPSGASDAGSLERLRWLAGCWEARSPQRLVEEQWMAAQGHCMIGVSRTVRGDSLAEYELVVLRERSGHLTYEAHPSGQATAVFTATSVTDTSVVFENPEHDFPQRVMYTRIGSDSVLARVDGVIGGRNRAVDFRYARGRCGGSAR
jgi:hypothetical protein